MRRWLGRGVLSSAVLLRLTARVVSPLGLRPQAPCCAPRDRLVRLRVPEPGGPMRTPRPVEVSGFARNPHPFPERHGSPGSPVHFPPHLLPCASSRPCAHGDRASPREGVSQAHGKRQTQPRAAAPTPECGVSRSYQTPWTTRDLCFMLPSGCHGLSFARAAGTRVQAVLTAERGVKGQDCTLVFRGPSLSPDLRAAAACAWAAVWADSCRSCSWPQRPR